ncbi:protein phosphatase methylesterase 1 [Sitophilus oryzae]|uniref:Protein phosphatase methylesterase 1 n=1 Tax=Sitophilus oryzae TaxID=7048 RepID=A0A6J2XAX3_SITOR|nr:protein phosphatase methylesterase 1 [Sitophilus oryzae]
MSDLRKSVLGLHHKKGAPTSLASHKPNYSPVKWQEYFEKEEYITTPSGQHHIYRKGSKGPIIFCLHGGGYNGLTWSLFAKEIYANIECQIIAVDFRGHGQTKTDNDDDLSLETLTEDVIVVANILCEQENATMILIGHSMGGAIAVNASYKINNLVGLCVIDVVEGTALDALSSMQSILRGRPSHFKSIPHAIQWCFKGGQSHNLEAARVSMPGQIVNMKTGKLASSEWKNFDKMDGTNLSNLHSSELKASEFTLTEVDEDNADNSKESDSKVESKPPLPQSKKFKIPKTTSDEDEGPKYTWRIDLSKTEVYWHHWFQGLSEKFLGSKTPKVLILANIHGLDTKLTVGQMQGKFQLQVLAKTGHAVQEDQPHQVAEILSIYLVKQKCAEIKPGFTMPLHPNTCC